MIDTTKFEMERLAKVMVSLRGKIDRTDYFEKGTIMEKAVAAYSGGQFTRINEVGYDFVDENGNTYEMKCTNISKKPRGGPQVSNFVIKNWHGKNKDFDEAMMSDYYIFIDVNRLEMCIVPKEHIMIKKTDGANVTACCDPLPEHFVNIPEVEYRKSFFALKKKWVESYLQSV